MQRNPELQNKLDEYETITNNIESLMMDDIFNSEENI